MREPRCAAVSPSDEVRNGADRERAEVLEQARRFKASWVDLAEALVRVRARASWKRWGYASLEEYAKTELHVRRETLEKLTGSYSFLQQRAPEVLSRGHEPGQAPAPSYQAVDFLRRAEDDGAPAEVVSAIRKRVIDEGAPLASVARQYRGLVGSAPGKKGPDEPGASHAAEAAAVRNVTNVAKRLRELLDDPQVAPVIPKELAGATARALDRLLVGLASRGADAA